MIPSVKEYTKPLFSIPTHHFLFFPGNINPKDFEDALMVEPNEYALIKFGERGTCLYRCGNERYLLLVQAPKYKSEILDPQAVDKYFTKRFYCDIIIMN